MNKKQKLEKFVSLVGDNESSFLKEYDEFESNIDWLRKSSSIAFKILEILSDKGWTQKQLAQKLNVSPQRVNKIVKGNENLTLEGISKLEAVLETKLIEIVDYSAAKEIETTAFYISPVSYQSVLGYGYGLTSDIEGLNIYRPTRWNEPFSVLEITNSWLSTNLIEIQEEIEVCDFTTYEKQTA